MAFHDFVDHAALSNMVFCVHKHILLLAATAAVGILLLTWRIVMFSTTIFSHPDEPKELPYWIPFLGHLFEFFGNSDGLLTRSRQYFGNTREPFALTILGMKTYVLTKGEDVAEVYRNTETLSYEEFVRSMMRILGNTGPCIKTMFSPLPKDKEGFPNPHGKSMGMLFREMHIHQLFPGANLTLLEDSFSAFFNANLTTEGLARVSYASQQPSGSFVVPLVRWCSDYFTKAGQDAYFGPKLAEIDPSLTDDFLIFDELSYQVIYQYPHFMARELQAARNRILRAFTDFNRLPPDERPQTAWFVGASESEMRALGLSPLDIAIATMTIYWAINTNTRKAAFWLLAYLVETPTLLSVVREEVAPAFRSDGTIDTKYLRTCTPQLDAMWSEMLRLSSFAASVRFITADTVIGGKNLRSGNRLMVPYRQLHMDQAVFGDRIDSFQHERFLKQPRLAQGASFRPFGGGSTACPGRHIAKRAVFMFTAMLVHRFDIEIVPGQKMLEADLTKPVPGLMSPKAGVDMMVEVRARNI